MISLEQIENVIPEVNKMIEIAQDFFKEYLRNDDVLEFEVTAESMREAINHLSEKNVSFQHFLTIPEESFKILYCLMYFGRDYYEEDGTPIEVFNKIYESVPYHKDRRINLSQMNSKFPLSKYLINAKKLFSI